MSVPEIELAQAVVDSINGAAFQPALVATREYLLQRKTLESMGLACTVYTVGLDIALDTRGADKEVHTCGIAIHQKVASVAVTTIDPLVALVRQVREHFRRAKLLGSKVTKRSSPRVYDSEFLKENLFVGYIELEVPLIVEGP